MQNKEGYMPYISGIGFSIIFGFSFMFSRIALGYATVFQLVGLRFLLAFAALLALAVLRVIKINLKRKDVLAILPLAVFQPVVYFIGETYGIANTSSSLSGIFMSLIPIFTAGLSYVMLKERINRKQVVFILLSVVGVAIISLVSLSDGKAHMGFGILCLVLAVVSASFYAVLTRKLTRTYSAIEITFVMLGVGAAVFSAAGLAESGIRGYDYFEPLRHLPFIMAWLFLGLLSSVVAFFLMAYTGTHVSASQNALFANLVTVIAIFAGGVFLHETVNLWQIIGSALIVAGVWGANAFAERKGAVEDVPIVK